MDENEAIKKLREIRSFDGSTMVLKNKYTVRGALIGLSGGFVISMYYKKNKIIGMVLGTIAGSFAGNIYGKYFINDSKSDIQQK